MTLTPCTTWNPLPRALSRCWSASRSTEVCSRTSMPRSSHSFPNNSDLRTPEKDQITLRHLLSMTSGLDWPERATSSNDPANIVRRGARDPGPYHFVLERSVEATPGTAWNYNSRGVWLLGL